MKIRKSIEYYPIDPTLCINTDAYWSFRLTRESCHTNIVAMKNVTITLEEEVSRWARVWAAKHNTSVSRLVGELLRQQMLEEEGYDAAMKQYLSHSAQPLREKDQKYPTRDELYDRKILR